MNDDGFESVMIPLAVSAGLSVIGVLIAVGLNLV